MELLNVLDQIPAVGIYAVAGILLILTVVMVISYFKNKKLDGVREDVYKLILKAEHKFKTGEGKKKLDWVVKQTIEITPTWLRFFVSDKSLLRLIDTWFLGVKDLLDDGKMNDSPKRE